MVVVYIIQNFVIKSVNDEKLEDLDMIWSDFYQPKNKELITLIKK